MNIRDDALRLGQFDISALQARVDALTEADWIADTSRQQIFDAHARTHTIRLIFDADYRHTDPTIHPFFHAFAPLLAPLMSHIRGYYLQSLRQRRVAEKHGDGYFVRIILTRLAAGAEITPHVDDGQSLRRCHRIHVPLFTHPDCQFTVGAKTWNMPAGEMWEINNRRIHAVSNASAKPRVHLILDYVQPGETIFDLEPLTA
ncbi:aspartyl/asparaginyl beta-hydroxylase domain-containing protein [Asticcacaulis sp. 201]|uniref:aspartyl/asparaginyl beta-hydroxylase domain-containing protein n=1 Tax=Asticcacaulis sp. 201 TaxID=3028787 RepID=UPI002916148F|nr:aspartyl/asparaginyl beta-hydroxylase domain-containing protein [Asticcacaulis sp. 201]MDV6331136.1 aspartyl/asparaginyl beta-hydroxylase domain-containing protein [Asticcacaulis sp. 201]